MADKLQTSPQAPHSAWAPPAQATPEEAMRAAGIDVRPVPRAPESTPEALRQAVTDRQGPMVFPGLCDGWPARTAWTPEELRRRHGDREVTALLNLPSDGVLLSNDQKRYERTMTFARFIDLMLLATASSPCYLAYQRAEEIFDRADYDFESLLPGNRFGTDTRVWIGSAGTRSMLHSDLKDNLFCQVWGEKSVTLLPWRDARAAYPFKDNLVNSQVDLAHPDGDRFPRLRKATFYNAMMKPGDVLLIPRGCWHDIRSCEPSVSVNHWFGKPLSFVEYMRVLATLGPRHWLRTARDFVVHGVFRQREKTLFLFSPPSTGRRLYDALRSGNFSRENDPSGPD